MSVLVKLCGMTRSEDIQDAAELGSDFFGVVVQVPWSRRSCTVDKAASLFLDASRLALPGAALFCDHDEEFILRACSRIKPFAAQLQGNETPELVSRLRDRLPWQIWKAVHVSAKNEPRLDAESVLARCREFQDAGASLIILDTMVKSVDGIHFGGTGEIGDWDTAGQVVKAFQGTIFLAGGLKPENVAEAIRKVSPVGVDLASGVESAPGIKDRAKMEAFVHEARRANDNVGGKQPPP